MARKKNINKNDLVSFYMNFVLEHNKKPTTVFELSKAFNFEESKFYNFFGNIQAVENHVFTLFFKNTFDMLNTSEDYKTFDSRNQLLSFYFTFFESLTANRSYVSFALKDHSNGLKSLKQLQGLRKHFTDYIKNLDIEIVDIKNNKIETIQMKAIAEAAWIQLLFTIKFWLEDSSAAFEKTDIFIEKAVNTSFDVLNIKPFKSVMDLGKFLLKEKMNMTV
ncbi:TetR family transcriptional regulator C-terminal domain-containing protein [Hanstruepera flava]|uniref:TetR family transcriptional regulator C-terminal domain-containing protein n=1 Tax=Hanstruepera flava TaxID=2930218 RepID=UPI0020280697|nr:TetR family transcriptional regulator C-terminal domain-containing protein [Hanstruepera flava]